MTAPGSSLAWGSVVSLVLKRKMDPEDSVCGLWLSVDWTRRGGDKTLLPITININIITKAQALVKNILTIWDHAIIKSNIMCLFLRLN